jgi:hypothetical protein
MTAAPSIFQTNFDWKPLHPSCTLMTNVYYPLSLRVPTQSMYHHFLIHTTFLLSLYLRDSDFHHYNQLLRPWQNYVWLEGCVTYFLRERYFLPNVYQHFSLLGIILIASTWFCRLPLPLSNEADKIRSCLVERSFFLSPGCSPFHGELGPGVICLGLGKVQ